MVIKYELNGGFDKTCKRLWVMASASSWKIEFPKRSSRISVKFKTFLIGLTYIFVQTGRDKNVPIHITEMIS